MTTDAVIGSDAVVVGAEAVRFTTSDGAIRTVPWKSIKTAGMSSKLEGHVTDQAVAQKIGPYLGTHDSLWMFYSEGGFARVMLEKSNARSNGIETAFAQHLGDRWRGDSLTEEDLVGPTLIPPKVQMPKPVMAIMAAVGIAFFLAMVILFFVHGAKPTSP